METKEKEDIRFFSLLSDTTFKFLFKKDKVRGIFERIIKYYIGVDLEGYTFIDNELNTGNMLKDYRLDSILVSPDKKHIINIEMNKENSNYVLLKNRTYIHRIAGNLLKANEDYSKIKDYHIEQVNFNNFYCNENKDVEINTYKLTDSKYNLTIENFKIHNIFIPKLSESCYNEVNKFMRLFCCENYEEMRKIASNDKEMNLLVDEIEKLNKEQYFGALYNIEEEKDLLIRSAKSEGLEEGIKENTIEVVKKMKEKNYSNEEISSITGLTKEEIDKI